MQALISSDSSSLLSFPSAFSALAAMLHDEILLYAQGQRAQTTLGLEGWTAKVIEDEEGGGQDDCVDEESTE